MILSLIVVYCIIILIDIKDLTKTDKMIKSTIIYWGLIGVGFVISLLQVIEKDPMSPTIIIEKLIKLILRG